MKKTGSKAVLRIIFFVILVLSLFRNFISREEHASASPTLVFGDALPLDGDSYWTEGNNLTYWVKPYSSDSVAWTNSETYYGSYALNWTHKNTATLSIVYFKLPSTINVTQYDFVFFKAKTTASFPVFQFGIQNLTNWDNTKPYIWYGSSGATLSGQWQNFVFPLYFGERYNGAQHFNMLGQVKSLYFYIGTGVAASGYSIFIDGLRFAKISVSTTLPSYSTRNLFVAKAFYNVIKNEYTVPNGKTSLRDGLNTTNGVPLDNNLETEVISQTIIGFLVAYNYSKASLYLDKAKLYGDFLYSIQLANGFIPSVYGCPTSNPTFLGWNLASLSMLYKITGNSTWKTMADKLQTVLMKLYDDPNSWFDRAITSALTITDATAWDGMKAGSACAGLGAYNYYVSSNSTIRNAINDVLNNLVTQTGFHIYYKKASYSMEGSEVSAYESWAFYYASKFNSTWTQYWLDTARWNLQHANMVTMDGRLFVDPIRNYEAKGEDLYNWALSNLVAITAMDNTAESLEAFQVPIWNFAVQNQSKWGGLVFTTRSANNEKYWEYIAIMAYMLAGVSAYFKNNPSATPEIKASTGNVTSISYTGNTLTFTINEDAGTTTETQIHVGDKGKPTSVSGATSWSYDSSSNILTVTALHSNSTTILVSWSPPGDINYDGTVDALDLSALSEAFGSTGGPPPSPDWNPDADINKDNNINILDLYTLGKNYGKTDP